MRARFLTACRWLTWGSWEFGRGIDIDQDGGIDGSGWMVRIEIPSWLRAWARRRLPQPTEAELRLAREDISDVVLSSMLTRSFLGYTPGVKDELGYQFDQREKELAKLIGTEDRLNP